MIMDKKYILIAEDDPDDRMLLQTAFIEKFLPERLEFVENGAELINYLQDIERENETGKNYPGVILLDLNMPKKNGRETLTEIKVHPQFKKIPVIIFTTTKNDSEIKRCYELGANTYIVKPHNYNDLLKVLSELRKYWFNIASLSS
jgi:two-component system response regulator